MRLNYHQLHDKGERYMFATFKMSPNFFDEKSLEKYYENGIRLYDAAEKNGKSVFRSIFINRWGIKGS